MTLKQFEDLVIKTKNSINSGQSLHSATVKMWYDEYFKYYELEKLKPVFFHLAETGGELNLRNLLEKCQEFYGYNLHEELKRTLDIMNKAKSEGLNIKATSYPKLSKPYTLPRAEVWEIAFNIFQRS
jgi:hypothetical protein